MPQKIPARRGGIYALTENVSSPFHAEPRHWDDEVIYKMDDGSIWQQVNYHYHYHYAYHPGVIIYPTKKGTCHIKVEDDDDEGVDVTKLK